MKGIESLGDRKGSAHLKWELAREFAEQVLGDVHARIFRLRQEAAFNNACEVLIKISFFEIALEFAADCPLVCHSSLLESM